MLSMIEECEFIDLGALGSKFTWERTISDHKIVAKRLDKALGDVSWRLRFPEAYVEHLARVYSNHCPVLVRCKISVHTHAERPFCFHVAWVTTPPLSLWCGILGRNPLLLWLENSVMSGQHLWLLI